MQEAPMSCKACVGTVVIAVLVASLVADTQRPELQEAKAFE
jgi:hypothetical protein